MFTDIHFGKKSNSETHNQDCIDYIDWFCEQVKSDPTIDHIWFLGDWNENRSAINGLTLKYSYLGAKKINDLGLRVFCITGNHDLHHRNTRDIYNTEIFDSLSNYTLINDITLIDDIHGGVVGVPFLMEGEYEEMLKYKKVPVVIGHLELKGFVMTGSSNILEEGPDPERYFKHQKRVFSGHFHKRSQKNNVHYIGNTFPMDYSDTNDNKRGMAVYDFRSDDLKYINWSDCPKYVKTKLSDLMVNPKKILNQNARVKVIVDQDITLSENNELKKIFAEKYGLREIVLEEQIDTSVDLTEIEQEVEDLKLEGIDQIIPELLKRVKSDKIDANKLVEIYKKL